MNMERLSAVPFLLLLATLSGAELQSSVERPCPGENVMFTCALESTAHRWEVPSLGIIRSLTPADEDDVFSDEPFQFNVTEVVTGTSITSTATFTAATNLTGTLVVCQDGNQILAEKSNTINILGPPSVPTLSCVELSEDVSGTVNVTVSWTLSGGDSANFYLISITTNAPQTPYGGLLNITNASITQHELTGFMTDYEYNITVRGVNCESQAGNESIPLVVTPQVPVTPIISEVCAVYDKENETLQIIETTWNELDNVTVSEDCANGQDIRASYELSYNPINGTTTCVVNGTECSGGTCHYDLQKTTADTNCQRLFSSEGVTVSVTARNVVGRSNPAVSSTIDGTNVNILSVDVDASNPTSALVECTFFQPGYNCTIEYGTDPSYYNLVYRDTSFTQGQMATITLSEELERNTTYYYFVSVISNTQCVKVQGRFRTECTVTDLTDLDIPSQDEVVDPRCTDRGFMSNLSITDGVACYDRTTAGSRAVYICNNDTEIDEFTRVCQTDGNWNGSIPTCPDFELLEERHIALIVISAVIREFAILYAAFHETFENMKTWHIVLIVVATIWWIFTVGFWIAVAVVVSHPSDANTCDPSCSNGLIIGGLVIACVAMIFIAAVVVFLGCHNRRKINRWQFLLIGIAAIFWIVGMAIWCAMGVIVANPPDGNIRDTGWQDTRNGLIYSGLAIFIVAAIFIVVVILFQSYYRCQIAIEKMELCQIGLILTATALWVIGVILWIAVGVFVANPLNQNTRDPVWQFTRDGLIYSGLVFSIVVITFMGSVVSVQVYHKTNQIKKQYTVLLVISTILSEIGVGLLIALAVVVCHRTKDTTDGRDDDSKSNCYTMIKNIPEWLLVIIIVLLCLTVVGIPVAIVMIIYINCKTKEVTDETGVHSGNTKTTIQPESVENTELKDAEVKKEGASCPPPPPPAETLEYNVVGTEQAQDKRRGGEKEGK